MFREPEISGRLPPGTVLHHNTDKIDDAARSTQAYETDTYSVPRLIPWRIFHLKGIRCDDTYVPFQL